MRRIAPYILPAVSAVTGFTLMAYELVAARLLAPSIGSSTYVWTAVIGVIIAALSFGYWFGGKIADARHQALDIARLSLCAAFAVAGTKLFYTDFLHALMQFSIDIRIQAVIAALMLFAPASFFLGAIAPYLVKLHIKSLQSSGRAAASLSTWNAIGSIIGTFVTGFILFGYVGSRETLVFLVALLVAVSWIFSPKIATKLRLVISAVIIAIVLMPPASTNGGARIDTASAHYEIKRQLYNGQSVITLQTGPDGVQSAVLANGNSDLIYWYTKQMAAATTEQNPKRILLLGGGTLTMPTYLAQQLPDSQIDVVEIDPQLETIARDYFHYKSPPNVRVIADDARHFVQKYEGEPYDVILVDVYGDGTIPASFITSEFTQALQKIIQSSGIVVANIIAGVSGGPCQDLLAHISAVYKQSFSYATYNWRYDDAEVTRQNIIAIYGNEELKPAKNLQLNVAQPFTDNFAPSERLYFTCRNNALTARKT